MSDKIKKEPKEKSRRKQRYRKEWESIPEFNGESSLKKFLKIFLCNYEIGPKLTFSLSLPF